MWKKQQPRTAALMPHEGSGTAQVAMLERISVTLLQRLQIVAAITSLVLTAVTGKIASVTSGTADASA